MTRPLYDMFNTVPPHYDLLNTLNTWGLDRQWRRKTAEACLESSPRSILDICCGTGDLSYEIALRRSSDTEMVALDFSSLMVDLAARKTAGLDGEPEFVIGDASELPFPDRCFDCIGISFAFRNLTYRNPKSKKHLAEIFRVLKPGGRFVIIESSQPGLAIIRKLCHLYLRLYVKNIGTLISGNKGAYTYLAESAARFYTPEEIRGMLRETGFDSVRYRPFLFGAAGLHVALKK